MAKELNIPVKAEGADKTKAEFDRLSEALEKLTDRIDKLGDKAKESGKKQEQSNKDAAEATEQLTSAQKGQLDISDKLEKKIAALLTQYFGITAAINAVTQAIQAQTQATEENAAILEKQQGRLLRLQYLGDLFKDRPELRKEVGALAEFGRRPFEQVADAWYNLRSKSGGMSDDQQAGILREALEMGRTDPSLPLDTLVDMFSLYAKQSGVSDANRIQNVLQQTITDAGGSGADVANYMPQFLPIGMSGGLTAAQSSGLWAYVTTQMASASIATTGLRGTFMGLQGKGTPESQKMLSQFGLSPDMDFFSKIGTLSSAYQDGTFGLAEAEQIAGREGASVFLSMLKDPQAMMRIVGNVMAVDRGDIDLTGAKIEGLFASDPVAKTEEDMRQLNVRLENQKSSNLVNIQRMKSIKEKEFAMRAQGLPEASIKAAQIALSATGALGFSPETIESAGEYYQQSMEAIWGFKRESPVIVNDYSTNLYRSEGQAGPRVQPE